MPEFFRAAIGAFARKLLKWMLRDGLSEFRRLRRTPALPPDGADFSVEERYLWSKMSVWSIA